MSARHLSEKWEPQGEGEVTGLVTGIASMGVSPSATDPSSPSEASPSKSTAFPFNENDLSALTKSVPNTNAPYQFPPSLLSHYLSTLPGYENALDEFGLRDPETEVYEELNGPRDNSIYSRKVFIGGLPKTMSGFELCQFFSVFGPVTIDWPHRERVPDRPPHGYAFAVFKRASSVEHLVNACNISRGKHCINIQIYVVQVRPWIKSDREHFMPGFNQVSSARSQRFSIFIGGVARTTTARILAETIDAAIGDVVAVRIEVDYDTDYPKGAARVIFASEKAYVTAIARRFISMNSQDLHKDEYKEVEMKPYLEDCMICENCRKISTRLFCAELRCLKYFCDSCWKEVHSHPSVQNEHRPMLKGLHQTPKSYGPHPPPSPFDSSNLNRTNLYPRPLFEHTRRGLPLLERRPASVMAPLPPLPADFHHNVAAIAAMKSRHANRRGVIDFRSVVGEQPNYHGSLPGERPGYGTLPARPRPTSWVGSLPYDEQKETGGGGFGKSRQRLYSTQAPSPFSPASSGHFSFEDSISPSTDVMSPASPMTGIMGGPAFHRKFFPS